MKTDITVIICAYNPKPHIFKQVLDSLKKQTLDKQYWELIIIDNKSKPSLAEWIDINWHNNAKIEIENQPGLIFSRIKGNRIAKSEFVVTVDDDTPLDNKYLETVLTFFSKNADVGIVGGKCFPIYNNTHIPSWINLLPSSISGRDFGNKVILEKHDVSKKLSAYPKFSPILMTYRRSIFEMFVNQFDIETNGKLGRKGTSLASGEDNDIILFFYKTGWASAYCPKLIFSHFIPEERLTFQYAKRLLFESNRSWVKVLFMHQICPWRKIKVWTLPFRYIKSFFFLKAWKSETNQLNWKSSCGTLKGLSEI